MADTKKQKREDVDVPENGDVDPEVVQSLGELEKCQEELDQINEEAGEKVLQIEQQYSVVRRPVYLRRNAAVRKIPEFWKQTLKNHPVLSDLITADDEEALGYLGEVLVDDNEDIRSGFSISFKFEENPFFTDAQLNKSVTFLEDGQVCVAGSVPNWKEGMGPSDDAPQAGQKRERKRSYSFFQWIIEAGNTINGDEDDIAAIIKDEIWPNPIKFYDNQEDEDEFDGEDGDVGDLDDDEEEYDGDNQNDENNDGE